MFKIKQDIFKLWPAKKSNLIFWHKKLPTLFLDYKRIKTVNFKLLFSNGYCPSNIVYKCNSVINNNVRIGICPQCFSLDRFCSVEHNLSIAAPTISLWTNDESFVVTGRLSFLAHPYGWAG